MIYNDIPTARDIERILLDDQNKYYDYVLYQLFSITDVDSYVSISARNLGGVIEIAAIGEGQSIVAALHFEENESMFVQYFQGDVLSLASSLMLEHLFGESDSRDVDEWRELVNSFSYKPAKLDMRITNEY